MATYIQGLTDYIPQIQPFKPDFNVYGNLLQMKQAQTDIGRKRFGSIYASLLYAPMTGEDNIKKRDDYFKMIEQDIKKVSAMDLSLPQNQSAALKIFDPILEDDNIAHDMAFTKKSDEELARGDSFRLCNDPKKCGGQYWKEGLTYINAKKQEYKEATPEERLKMSAPIYTPFINLTDKAFEWTKAQGLVVKSVSTNGQYIVTRQNGKDMLLPLNYIYTALYGQDPQVKAMFDVSAYLHRQQYIEQNKANFGGDKKQAEDQWFNEVLKGTATKQIETKAEVDQIHDFATNKKKALESDIKDKGLNQRILNDPLWDEYQDATDDAEVSGMTKKHYDDVTYSAKNISSNIDDREIVRQRIDSIVASGLLQQEIGKTAALYAMSHNAITDIKADNYGLEQMKHNQAMERLKTKANLDLRNAFLLEAGSMSDKMFNGFNLGAYGQDGKVLPNGPGNVTGPYGEGGADLYGEITGALEKGNIGTISYKTQFLNEVQNHLNNIIAQGNPAKAEYAKSVMKKIFPNAYDQKNNQFKKGDLTVSSFNDLDLNAYDLSKYYANARQVFSSEKSLFKTIDAKVQPLLQEEEQMNVVQTAAVKALEKNSSIIYKAVDAMPQLNIKDINAFKRYFKVYDNGKVMIKPRKEYIEEAVNSMKGSFSQDQKIKKATEDYDTQTAEYKRIYNSGLLPLSEPIGYSTITKKPDGGRFSNVISYNVDPRFPYGSGTRGFLSMTDDMRRQGAVTKILFGSNHQSVGTPPPNLDYNNLQSSNDAARVIAFAEKDMRDQAYKGTDKVVPTGEIRVSAVGANNSNLMVATFVPSYDWLVKYAKQDRTTKKLYAFGKPIDELSSEGVSVYFNAGNANSLLFNQMKKSPYDLIMDTGEPVKINYPNSGNMTVQKANGKTSLSGTFWGWEKQDDGTFRKANIQNINNLSWGENDLSAGMLYKSVLDMMTDLNTRNSNYLEYGQAPTEQPSLNIQQSMRNAGYLQPSPDELMIQDFQKNFSRKMSIANAIYKSISEQ